MKRLMLVTLAAVTALAMGCEPSRSGSLGTAPGTPQPTTGAPAPAGSGAGRPACDAQPVTDATRSAIADATPGANGVAASSMITLEVWLTRDGRLFPTRRVRPTDVATSRLALNLLKAGPCAEEFAENVRSDIDPQTTFSNTIAAGAETVDFPATFYDGGRDAARLRQAQVVYTLTQFSTVTRLLFQREGKPTAAPVGRADYADLLPAITVTAPAIGQRVTSPIAVMGTANVFEATVSLRVLDGNDREIAHTFTTATCGTGCRGEYSVSVTYSSPTGQRGTIEVYEVSARDGSRLNVVRIPVVLGGTPQ